MIRLTVAHIKELKEYFALSGYGIFEQLADDLLEAREVLGGLIEAHHRYCECESELLTLPMEDRRGSVAHAKTAEAIRVLGLAEDRAEEVLGIVNEGGGAST